MRLIWAKRRLPSRKLPLVMRATVAMASMSVKSHGREFEPEGAPEGEHEAQLVGGAREQHAQRVEDLARSSREREALYLRALG
jgi:hypothetical protein